MLHNEKDFEFDDHKSTCRKVANELGLKYAKVKHSMELMFNANRVKRALISYEKVYISGMGTFLMKRIQKKKCCSVYHTEAYKHYVDKKRHRYKVKIKKVVVPSYNNSNQSKQPKNQNNHENLT